VIRIRLRTRQSFGVLRLQTALALAALFAPSALVALTMCFWSFAAELGFVSAFYVTTGIFCHWQVWFFAAALLLAGARLLTSYGTANVEAASQGNSNFHNANPQFAENRVGISVLSGKFAGVDRGSSKRVLGLSRSE